MLLLYFLLGLSLCAVLFISRGWPLKNKFNIPFYCLYISSDTKKGKPNFLRKKELVGVPDALFFNPLQMRYIVGELKSRHYTGEISVYEKAQVTLYLGMCDKWFLLKPRGVMLYGNGMTLSVRYNRKLFKEIFKLRQECLSVLKNK